MRISRELKTLRITQSMDDVKQSLDKAMISDMLHQAEELELFESCAELKSLLSSIERDEKINQILS